MLTLQVCLHASGRKMGRTDPVDDILDRILPLPLTPQAGNLLAPGLPLPGLVVRHPDCGLIEVVPNAKSLDSVKKTTPNYFSLSDFFRRRGQGDGSEVALNGDVTEQLARATEGADVSDSLRARIERLRAGDG